MTNRVLCVLALSAGLAAGPAAAEAPVKIGMITTLSTKAGYLGEDIRDGFQLAIDQGDGKLGGIPVELMVDDDGRKPGKGKQIAERYIKRDKAMILTGIVFSNVAMAVVPKVVREGVFYISPNAGPSKLAGKGCHENYFNVAWQNDNLHEATGQYLNDKGFKNVYLLAPNYPAGKDALTGFKGFIVANALDRIHAPKEIISPLVQNLPKLWDLYHKAPIFITPINDEFIFTHLRSPCAVYISVLSL